MTIRNSRRKSSPSDSELARFLLPHVTEPEKRSSGPRCWWSLPEPRSATDTDRPVRFGSYMMDCLVGDALASNLLYVCRRFPQEAETVISMTLHDIIVAGRLSGVEIAFSNTLASVLSVLLRSRLPLSAVPDDTAGGAA